MDLPGIRECCWMAGAPETGYPALRKSASAEVAIVGLTAVYLLAQVGVSVTVLEARQVGRQVTGRSTAKVTSQHTLIYKYLIQKFGFETARLYADANQTPVRQICDWVKDRIDRMRPGTKGRLRVCSPARESWGPAFREHPRDERGIGQTPARIDRPAPSGR